MIQMFIHQHRPLLRSQPPKETMRMRSTPRRPRRNKPIDQFAQPSPFFLQIPLILNHQIPNRRRITPNGGVIPQSQWFYYPPENQPDNYPRRPQSPQPHFQPTRTMRHRLRRIHAAPLPLAVRPQPPKPGLHFIRRPHVKQILHKAVLPHSEATARDRAQTHSATTARKREGSLFRLHLTFSIHRPV
jgi:hypothetical protein